MISKSWLRFKLEFIVRSEIGAAAAKFPRHCEERSDVAIRSPQHSVRIRRKPMQTRNILPQGMRIATPVCALARNDVVICGSLRRF